MEEKEFLDKWYIIFILLLTVLSAAFYMQYNPYDGKITHDFPKTINAGDPNSRLSEAEWIKESNSYDLNPPWFSDEKKVLMHYPPILVITPAILSQLSNVEVYDFFYFIGVLISVGVAICFFIIFKKFLNNDLTAFICAMLIYYPYEFLYHYQLNIGMFGNHYSALFFPLGIIFLMNYIDAPSLKNGFFLVLNLVIQYYVHASESIAFFGFIGLYLLIFKRKTIGIKKIACLVLIYFVLVLPHLSLLYSSWMASQGSMRIELFKPLENPAHEPQFTYFNLVSPILYIFLLIGLVFSLLKEKYRLFAIICLFYFIVTMVLSKIGLGTYYITLRGRYLLYVFFYPLIAIGIAAILNTAYKITKAENLLQKDKFILVCAIIFLAISLTYLTPPKSEGTLITKGIYDGFLWVRHNTPADAKVLCFGCGQFEGLNTHRIIFQPDQFKPDAVANLIKLNNTKVSNRTILAEYCGYSDTYPVKEGLFKVKMLYPKGQPWINIDICSVDYFIARSFGQLTPLIEQISKKLIAKNGAPAYSNNDIIIIKNNFKNGECI